LINRPSISAIDKSAINSYFIYDDYSNIKDWYMRDGSGISSFEEIPLITEVPFCNTDFPNITDGTGVFRHNNTLLKWEADLSGLVYGNYMFDDSRLNTFKGSLKNLKDGTAMFGAEYDGMGNNHSYDNLIFETDSLESLEIGNSMFYEKVLQGDLEWKYDMPNLVSGVWMFGAEDWWEPSPYSFSGDLSSLENGDYMFCNSAMREFRSQLPKLKSGMMMFDRCFLSKESVEFLIEAFKQNMATTITYQYVSIGASASLLDDDEFWAKYGVDKPIYEDGTWARTISVTNKNGLTWFLTINGNSYV
jgi:hypothetical protein